MNKKSSLVLRLRDFSLSKDSQNQYIEHTSSFKMVRNHAGSALDWKKINLILVFVTATMLTMPACHSMSQQTSPVVNENNIPKEGWIDGNTFRVMVMGAPRRGEKDIRRRKKQAKAAAIIYAQRTIVEKFVYLPLNPGVGFINIEPRKAHVIKQFEKIIKAGNIIEISYDKKQFCEIVYEVKASKLKKKVMYGIN